ncbi:tyrosyl-DNA phosphodiesterase-domain-containing protein [Glomus cerebriforme]|uniref:Tyrosyl-DNA phosphodiesterase-domain-containing protein n=1 Tax=Glomus cerebriforme TaxID=658196 RepID=A0A397TCH8_9GLOM|nr:tyrosyl-DNA phosphodiesterase-domain-containing protein [Glomus cerebriforme]
MRSKANVLGPPDNNREGNNVSSQLTEDMRNVKRQKKGDENRSNNQSIIKHSVIIEKIGPQFLDGITKLTYVSGYNGDYIRFGEIIQKNQLKSAFFCAMTIEFSWLLENLPKNANIIVAKHWDPENDSQGIFCIPNTNILLVHPPMSSMGHGCFHAKLMILIYNEWIRVVISSANLIPHDWEISENIVFVQDFPRYKDDDTTDHNLHSFAKELKDYLLAMGLKSHIIDKFSQYDFSKAKAIIIPSIPGAYKGIENVKKYGHGRLSQVVKGVCKQSEYVELECQSSSLGSITPDFLNEFYRSAKGLDPYIIPKQRKSKKDKEHYEENESPQLSPSQPSQPSQLLQLSQQLQLLPPITIVYPTNKIVLNSKYTFAGAGPLCFSKKCYEQLTFPKEILRKCESNRNGTLMHTKFLLARFIQPSQEQLEQERLLKQEQRKIRFNKRKIIKNQYDSDESATDSDATDIEYYENEIINTQETIRELELSQDTITDDVEDNNIVGWYYCGSHNFTESAWGKLNISRDTKELQLKIYNWELGIFLPITKLNDDNDKENNMNDRKDWFSEHGVPVSYQRPPKCYEENDIPWVSSLI